MIQVGDAAPDFTVKDHEGRDVSLAKLRGKTVVLWFFPKADTPGWTIEGCGFRDLAKEFERKNAAILGVSFDTPAENKAFAEKFGFPFPLLCDTGREMGVAYGATDTLAGGNARRIGVVVGPDGRIKEWLPKVDPRAYPSEVLSRI